MKATLDQRLAPAYLNERVRLQPSLISGHGLYAAAPIGQGQLVAMFGGRVYDREQLANSPEMRRRVLRVEENLFIGPAGLQSDAPEGDPSLINHSCEPNCGLYGQIGLVALRDIPSGEELTIDYATAGSVLEDFDCECGAVGGCRGRITGDDHLRPELRERYAAYLSPWLVRPARRGPHEDVRMQFETTGAWGLATQLDLHDCNPETIRDAQAIKAYTYELCDRLGVKRFGEPTIVHFGQDERVAGYSLVQLIETSLVSGHFANLTNRVYMDIFSCAYYNPAEMASFSVEFFGAKSYNINSNLRH